MAEGTPQAPEQFNPTGPIPEDPGWSRRRLLITLTGAGVALGAASCSRHEGSSPATSSGEPSTQGASPEISQSPEEVFLRQTAQSLIDLGEKSEGGWRFQSQIQSPHYQTDRDVGAASVGMGFLVMADRYPHEPTWLNAAEKAATWLSAVGRKNANGISWPDYADDSGESTSVYTSFDDGALGVGDFFWRLYEKTGNADHKDTALASVEWIFSQAEQMDGGGYRWIWDISKRGNPADSSDNAPVYSMGMGEGLVGTIHTLATYYERTRTTDPAFAAKCKNYIDGGLHYLQNVRDALGQNDGDSRAIPETADVKQTGDSDGDTAMNAGYLSGAAGGAFMYLKLYEVFGDQEYLTKADELFSWLEDTENGPMVDFGDGTVAWKLMLDPQGGDNPIYATGVEEGSAGIGWTYLQAYKVTGQEKYLTMAKKAADWLYKIAIHDEKGGLSWREDENPPSQYVHSNLNNGAAGVGMFFYDLYKATKDASYQRAAQGALTSIMNSATHDHNDVYWQDTDDENGPYSKDPSWHWGSAGIVAFTARVTGGSIDIIGQQDALAKH